MASAGFTGISFAVGDNLVDDATRLLTRYCNNSGYPSLTYILFAERQLQTSVVCTTFDPQANTLEDCIVSNIGDVWFTHASCNAGNRRMARELPLDIMVAAFPAQQLRQFFLGGPIGGPPGAPVNPALAVDPLFMEQVMLSVCQGAACAFTHGLPQQIAAAARLDQLRGGQFDGMTVAALKGRMAATANDPAKTDTDANCQRPKKQRTTARSRAIGYRRYALAGRELCQGPPQGPRRFSTRGRRRGAPPRWWRRLVRVRRRGLVPALSMQ
jgi:hypothetical protein